MIQFDPFIALLIILFAGAIPGTAVSYALLRKHQFSMVEHAGIGIFIGMILPSMVPMILEPFGILFFPSIAYLSYGLLWAAAIGTIILTKTHENFSITIPKIASGSKSEVKELIINALLVIILIVTYLTRIQSYSPVFEELDPYFYAFISNQIVTLGHNPAVDYSAWVPEVETGHRTMPIFGYMGALWYSITQSVDSHHLVSLSLNLYPPLAAALMAFFIYLAVKAYYRPEYGLAAATIASFLPIVLIKFSAGEIEIQPLAFMTLAAFFASLFWTIKTNDLKFVVIATVAFLGLSMGTSSANIAINALIMFIPLYGMTLYLKNEDMKPFLVSMAAVLGGIVLVEILLRGIYFGYFAIPKKVALPVIELALCGALYHLQKRNFDLELRAMTLCGIFIAAIAVVAFSPLGGVFLEFFRGGLEIATYTNSLQRTIAEQGTAGSVFQETLGFVAITPGELKEFPGVGGILEPLASILFFLPSLLVNLMFKAIFLVLNSVLHVTLEYGDKSPSLFFTMIGLFVVCSAYGLYRAAKYETYPVLLFVAILFPVLLVGVLKAKYTIYAGVFLAMGIGMVLGEGERLLSKIKRSEEMDRHIYYGCIGIAAILSLGQFVEMSGGISGIGLMKSSLTTRYQDNPLALQEHFKSLCAKTRVLNSENAEICGAAEDPVGFASKSIENQYSQTLCIYSTLRDVGVEPTPEEYMAINYRCNRMKDYWLETMFWVDKNPDENLRIYSWWDYGHWTNWFGQKDTVLRNDHASAEMIGRVAYTYTMGTQEELIEVMEKYQSEYILVDGGGDGIVKSKFGALNYLGCAWANQTNLTNSPGRSVCELENRWEEVYLPKDESLYQGCIISESQGTQGVLAISSHYGGGYCVGPYSFPDGRSEMVAYYLDQKDDLGNLRVNRAFLQPLRYDSFSENGKTYEVLALTTYYTKQQAWNVDGAITDGYADRKGRYYDSVLYRSFYMDEMPGFEKVFTSKGGEVKIYKLVN